MIESVTMNEAKWAASPKRFEAGVPNMAQAVGFAAAINYLNELGMDNVAKHEHDLTAYALEKFLQLDKVEVIGPKRGPALGEAKLVLVLGGDGSFGVVVVVVDGSSSSSSSSSSGSSSGSSSSSSSGSGSGTNTNGGTMSTARDTTTTILVAATAPLARDG